MTTVHRPPISFQLPTSAVATEPPEERGVARDGVRMLVAGPAGISHRVAADLPDVLAPGDVLVVNDSQTMPASLRGTTTTGEPVEIHLSTVLPDAGVEPSAALAAPRSEWVVEFRTPAAIGSVQSSVDRGGIGVDLVGGGSLRVHSSQPPGHTTSRLWQATISTPRPLAKYLGAFGHPIRYDYVARPWPISAYRTVHGQVLGSAEMPSAGRPLTWRLLERLRQRGIQLEHIILHCGVSSLESGEPPYSEWFSVPVRTMAAITAANRDGRRVIAVGTTVVRALESAAAGRSHGWTDLVITGERKVSTVDGMITGWHEPEASHLDMLDAVAGRELLIASYTEALEHGYRWHEFGDLHLILP